MPANPDDALDSMTDGQYEKDKFLPYWAQQWPASHALFNFILSGAGPSVTPGGSFRICELGSGLGTVSALLCAQGKHSIATDISLDACRYSAYNIRCYSDRAMVVCSDWRTPPFKYKFDCMLASDILYEQRWISPVLDFLKLSLDKDGTVFIADPCRQWWGEFQNAAVFNGFCLIKVWQEIVNQGKTTVEILRLTRI
jgi:predicted nicotinamide N-methyase